jgi:hypothetical protein
VELKFNGAHKVLVCADDVNLLGYNIRYYKKNTETLIDSSKNVRLEVNVEKTLRLYMLLSRHQNAGQNHYMMVSNRCHDNVAQFRCLGTTTTNKNLIQEEIEFG